MSILTKLATAAALLAAIPSVSAVGKATITNNCDFPVYMWSCSNVPGEMQTINSKGGAVSESYRTNPDGGGISMKLATVNNLWSGAAITQLEYTLDGKLWYDVSNINGYPFAKDGLKLQPSDSSCPAVNCAAGVEECSSVYNQPHDDHATGACGEDSDIDLVLCSASGGSSNDSAPAPPPPAPKVKAPAPPKPKPAPAETHVAAPPPAPKPKTTKAAPPPPKPTTTKAAPAPEVTTMVTQVVTNIVNAQAKQTKAAAADNDYWIGHYPASWASFPIPEYTITKRAAEPQPTLNAGHKHYIRHVHGYHHHRRR